MENTFGGRMTSSEGSGRAVSLILDLGNGTTIVHGKELELPLREFRLLAALADRVGEPVATKTLIEAVWPDAPWTSNNDLYVLVSKLRRLIDGPDRFGANIRNRRGFGYLLDLPQNEVNLIHARDGDAPTSVIEDSSESTGAHPLNLTPQELSSVPPAVETEGPPSTPLGSRRTRMALAVLSLAALAASWSVGYLLSRDTTETSPRVAGVAPTPAPDDTTAGMERKTERRKEGTDRGRIPREKSSREGRTGGPALSGPVTISSVQAPTGSTANSSRQPATRTRSKPQAPPPPVAPTAVLYHLIHQETGDHFMTADTTVVSDYEAKGYAGQAIGRVYRSPQPNTKAIPTNGGTVYIFATASPKTEPHSETRTLWYAANNEGDFFYTTSQSEASQDGWSSNVVGYIRSLP